MCEYHNHKIKFIPDVLRVHNVSLYCLEVVIIAAKCSYANRKRIIIYATPNQTDLHISRDDLYFQ